MESAHRGEELTRWFPLEAGVNPDGTLWMAWHNEFRWESRIEISEPPRRFRMVALESLSGEKPADAETARQATLAEPTATDFFLEAQGLES